MLKVKTETFFLYNKVEELYYSTNICSIEIINLYTRRTRHTSQLKKAKRRAYFYDIYFFCVPIALK